MQHQQTFVQSNSNTDPLQVETLQQKCTASDTQTAQVQHQLSTLQTDQALLSGRLHDGSLDHIKGQLIQDLQQQLVTSSATAAAATAANEKSAAQLQELEEQLALQQQAQAAERERLSMEAAQSRLLCKARARQVSTLEAQSKAQVRQPRLDDFQGVEVNVNGIASVERASFGRRVAKAAGLV